LLAMPRVMIARGILSLPAAPWRCAACWRCAAPAAGLRGGHRAGKS
jgi:hypothetical protein